jgi:transcriptional regulator GlxA family with amidase domain
VTRRIVFVVFEGAEALDLTGPQGVFSVATQLGSNLPGPASATPRYRTELVAPTGGLVTLSSGLTVAAQGIAELTGEIDTLVVVGGLSTAGAFRDLVLVAWIRDVAPSVRRVASICTGAFLLAKAGVLDGRRATTHWAASTKLQEKYPQITVEPDPVYVRDGNVWTSAGVTAGIDMSLALLADDYGPEISSEVARWLVVFVERTPRQNQISTQLAVQHATKRSPLRELAAWIVEHLDADLSITKLAKRAGMSARNFSRVFVQETGITPAAFVLQARLDGARRALEGRLPIADVARLAGFGSTENLERAFRRELGTTPRDYRRGVAD